jgi:hypothetical protein
MCHYDIILLRPFFNIWIKYISYFLGGYDTIHAGHVDVHDDEAVGFLAEGDALFAFHNCLFA